MNRKLLGIIGIVTTGILLLGGCSFSVPEVVVPEVIAPQINSGVQESPAGIALPSRADTESESLPPSKEVVSQPGEPPIDKTWISPGKVIVTNFYAGARAEYPIRIHNGDSGERSEQKSVTTGLGETSGAIPIKGFPVSADGKDFTVTSEDGSNLTPVSYSSVDKSLLIEGFKPSATTVITISYISATQFSVYYRVPDHCLDGYVKAPSGTQDWVLIADTTPVIMPQTTKEIMIALDVPNTYTKEFSPKWEFWIGVSELSKEEMIQAELASRWLISSRE